MRYLLVFLLTIFLLLAGCAIDKNPLFGDFEKPYLRFIEPLGIEPLGKGLSGLSVMDSMFIEVQATGFWVYQEPFPSISVNYSRQGQFGTPIHCPAEERFWYKEPESGHKGWLRFYFINEIPDAFCVFVSPISKDSLWAKASPEGIIKGHEKLP